MLSAEDIAALRSLDRGIRTWLYTDDIATWERIAGPLLDHLKPPAAAEDPAALVVPVAQDTGD